MAEKQNINQNVNQAVYGLNMDFVPDQIKPGQLTYALNAQIDNFDGQMIEYQNEQSNVLCNEFKPGYQVIGVHNIVEQNKTIIFSHNPHTYDSEIGYIDNLITCDVDDPSNLNQINSNDYVNNGYNNFDSNSDCGCNKPEEKEILSFYELFKQNFGNDTSVSKSCCKYTTVINAKCLNFNINNPIHKIVHRIVDINDDSLCGTEIYWTDGINPRRHINLEDLPYKYSVVDCDRVKTGEVDCTLLEVQAPLNSACIIPVTVNDGGSLIAGSYQFAMQYTNAKGEAYGSYYSVTNAINIFQKSRYGLDYNFPTDKSIKLSITGLDLNYRYFNLAVAKTINGITDFELVGTYEIIAPTREVVYTGSDKTPINLTSDDIFEKFPYYRVAGELTSVNDTLVWADLKSQKRINYQSIASAIQLKWETYQIPYTDEEGYNNGVNTALYRGYMRDEVYGFEFVPILRNGQQMDGFHIPNRPPDDGDLSSIDSEVNEDAITKERGSCAEDDQFVPRWTVYNTATLIGLDQSYIDADDKNCYVGPYQYGNFAYWESEKRYPCDKEIWGDLADQPIRHHKFPDNRITHIHSSNPSSGNKEYEHKIYPIGIRIDMNNIKQAILNSNLTDEEKAEIVGFKIIRTDRVNNKSVIAKGLLYNVGSYTPYVEGSSAPDQETFYPNYPFNDLGDDPFLTNLSSVDDGGFNVSLLDRLLNDLDNTQQQLGTLQSLLQSIGAVTYTDTGLPTPLGTVVIEITNSQLNDIKNKIYDAIEDGQTLADHIAGLIQYYDNKISSGGVICSTDVAALTLNATLVSDYLSDVSGIDSSGAITNFENIITYVNANTALLNSHPSSTSIFDLKNSLKDIINVNTDLQNSTPAITTDQADYADSLTNVTDGLVTIPCTGSTSGSSSFARSRFTFHSPDTHFYQPYLGSILKLETLEGGQSIGNFVQVKDHAGHKLMSAFSAGIALASGILIGALFAVEPKLMFFGTNPGATKSYYLPPIMPSLGTVAEKALYWNQQFKTLISNLLPYKNYAYQYNAVGYYNQFEPIPNNGSKQRGVDKAYYLLPGMQAIGDTAPINNWRRESSVYFRTDQQKSALLFPNDPSIIGALEEDNSRVNYSSSKQIYSNVLSYYASHKRKAIDQYGEMYSYNVVDTGYCGKIDLKQDYTGVRDIIFGGDIFINRFGLKRKLSYFIDTAVGKGNEIDISYSGLSNIGKTRYWYNSTSESVPATGFKGLMKSILNVPQSNMDGSNNKLFYQNGRIYLYSYGIAYFFSESEINVDNRQAGNNKEKDFFPNVGTGIPNDWLQEVNVPIVEDNYYIYNKSYSKQNKENYFSHLPLNFDPNQDCVQDFTHRAIYSDPNKWNVYKAISKKDFPKNYGKLISIDAIDNNEVFIRFENKSFIYNALTTIQTSSTKYAYLGNDDVFATPPIDFGETDIGYAGSQHRFIVKSEAGVLFIDAKRGAIFLIKGRNIEPISDKNSSKWFANNLPFNISKQFPNVNVDNHFNGIGITGVWDSTYARFIITKLDYEPHKKYANDIKYDERSGTFMYKNMKILLNDPKYFCNKSWTVSYSPVIQNWVSFHSYLPNYYIPQVDHFKTGINGSFANQVSSTWNHDLVHTSFQTFYGKLEPYVLEYPFAYKYQDEIVQNVKDHTTILEYYNSQDYYEINDNVYFNKAILYNNQQTSGVRNLISKPKGKMNLYFNFPKVNKDSVDILYTKSDNFFNYNQFWDVVKNPNNHIPIWKESCTSKSIDRELNNDLLDYSIRSHQKTKIRAKNLRIRHINDKYSRYKFISKFVNAPTQISEK